MNQDLSLQCPRPLSADSVQMAHGGGGRAMHRLLEELFLPAFSNPALERRHDASVVSLGEARVAFTTDSYVVHPYFFPGGDLGSLAVHGTVNDLAMAGARPLFLSAGFILEEGLPLQDLERLVASMARAASEVGVQLVTGDTKVVDRGKADGLYVNTAGLGIVAPGISWHPQAVQSGDAVLVSGDLGRHGVAVMACREGLEFETRLLSDAAPLWSLVEGLQAARVEVHCLRDLTRGGLTSALVEISEACGMEIALEEQAIPVCEEVRGACELLGLDPLEVANEGRMVAFVAPQDARRALEVLRREPVGLGSTCIGTVQGRGGGGVWTRTPLGTRRPLDMPRGEQLPRIC